MKRKHIRAVALPGEIAGQLWLSAMPGRDAPLDAVFSAMIAAKVARIVCLCTADELATKSPGYARTLAQSAAPAPVSTLPVPDYSVPPDGPAFVRLAHELATDLARGKAVLIHCAAGIGRTGTMAICVLVASGLPLKTAQGIVATAGSGPETAAQQAFVEVSARQLQASA